MHEHAMASLWLPTHGRTWLETAASFLVMWAPMMTLMMTPAVAPTLWRYGKTLSRTRPTRMAVMTSATGAGYLLVWAALGALVFPVGAAFAAIELHVAPPPYAVSIATGLIVVLAGALQFTAWKVRALACCRELPITRATHASDALIRGLRLGLQCAYCCAGLTAMLLALGMMDWRAMMFVTAAITIERLALNSQRAAKAIGAVIIAVGLISIATPLSAALAMFASNAEQPIDVGGLLHHHAP